MEKFSKLKYLKGIHGVKISPPAFRVWVTVFNHSNEEGKKAHPGVARLAEECCLSASTVRRALKELEGAGWLWQKSRGHRLGNGAKHASEYWLTTPSTVRTGAIEADSQEVNSAVSTVQNEISTVQNEESLPFKSEFSIVHSYEPPSDHSTTDHGASDYVLPDQVTSEARAILDDGYICAGCQRDFSGEPAAPSRGWCWSCMEEELLSHSTEEKQ